MIIQHLSVGEPPSTKLIQAIFERMFSLDLIDNESALDAFEKVVKALGPIASEIIEQRVGWIAKT